MKLESDEKKKATLLYHLRRKRIIGAKYTHYDTLKTGFPSHLGRVVENIAKDLIKQGYIVTKPTNYGLQVSLSKGRIKEIEEFIKKNLGFEF